ncbi:hypothetical protein J1781_22015 [Rahnella sp. C60]|nr:hypothetical protein [Rahnella perminowiae]
MSVLGKNRTDSGLQHDFWNVSPMLLFLLFICIQRSIAPQEFSSQCIIQKIIRLHLNLMFHRKNKFRLIAQPYPFVISIQFEGF